LGGTEGAHPSRSSLRRRAVKNELYLRYWDIGAAWGEAANVGWGEAADRTGLVAPAGRHLQNQHGFFTPQVRDMKAIPFCLKDTANLAKPAAN